MTRAQTLEIEKKNCYENSVLLCRRLLHLLEEDRMLAQRCLGGQLLPAYQKATDDAVRTVNALLKELESVSH